MKAEMNIEVMANLYSFGGLIAYRVEWLDPISWKIKSLPATFNEDVAIESIDRLLGEGLNAVCFQEIIKFDGAFKAL